MRKARKYTDDLFIRAIRSCVTYREVTNYLDIRYDSKVKKRIIERARYLGIDISHISSTPLRSWTDNQLIEAVKDANTFKEIAEKLKLSSRGNNLLTIKKHIAKLRLDTSNLYKKSIAKDNKRIKVPLSEYLAKGTSIPSSRLKEKLFFTGIKKRKCELCGQGEFWMGKKISLILDHKNGDHKDNRIENLRIVCPNCDATLPTFCGKNKKKKFNENKKKNKKGYSEKQIKGFLNSRKVKRPSYKTLTDLLESNSCLSVAKKFGVSDNTIRKWVKSYKKNWGVAQW